LGTAAGCLDGSEAVETEAEVVEVGVDTAGVAVVVEAGVDTAGVAVVVEAGVDTAGVAVVVEVGVETVAVPEASAVLEVTSISVTVAESKDANVEQPM